MYWVRARTIQRHGEFVKLIFSLEETLGCWSWEGWGYAQLLLRFNFLEQPSNNRRTETWTNAVSREDGRYWGHIGKFVILFYLIFVFLFLFSHRKYDRDSSLSGSHLARPAGWPDTKLLRGIVTRSKSVKTASQRVVEDMFTLWTIHTWLQHCSGR